MRMGRGHGCASAQWRCTSARDFGARATRAAASWRVARARARAGTGDSRWARPPRWKRFACCALHAKRAAGAVAVFLGGDSRRDGGVWRRCVASTFARKVELLAAIATMGQFQYNLDGQRFILETHHSNLRCIINIKTPQVRLARWIMRLSAPKAVAPWGGGRMAGSAADGAVLRREAARCGIL